MVNGERYENVHVLTAMNSTYVNNPNQNLYIVLFTLKTGSKLVAEKGCRNYAKQIEVPGRLVCL